MADEASDIIERTTIKVTKPILNELKKLKVHPRQPYYEVIKKLLAERRTK